ncbi:MAG: Na/Pi cotransporter family protein [Ruminococcaceae bacterium]|nr:Na/Pi cotransporter family protein [Oscillospiraceae bacterium]
MSIFTILSLIGGLALFLFGMDYMGASLKKLSGGQLESILQKLASNRFRGFLLGFLVTAVIQSSSATTVMLVGFVNSGIMKLYQTIAVIMGANVGTTVTAWLLSTTGISASTAWLKLLKPESFTPVLALLGVLMTMVSKSEKRRNIGSILVGFAVLMFGMETMSDAMSGLKDNEAFASILVMFENPVLGILCGTVLTAIIQSSSASVGILQALSLTGAIPMATALPVILGQNIGTTITPVLSAISGNTDSKRVAISCVYIKFIGVIIVGGVFYLLDSFFDFAFMNGQASVFSIALVHTVFNIVSTVILIPFCTLIEKLAMWTFKSADAPQVEDNFRVLDDRFLEVPGFALEQSKDIIKEMMIKTGESVTLSLDHLFSYDDKIAEKIDALETLVDTYEDKLGSYLVKLAGHKLTEHEANEVTSLLHIIGDAERISDHACNLVDASKEIKVKKIAFSAEALKEIEIASNAVKEIVEIAIRAVDTSSRDHAIKIEPLEQVIDKLKYQMKTNHIIRLQNNLCTIELGFVYSDIITNFERIADHCSNIGATILQKDMIGYAPHDYLHHVKNDGENNFAVQYAQYLKKYQI